MNMLSPSKSSMAYATGKRKQDEINLDSDNEEESTSTGNTKRRMANHFGTSVGIQGNEEFAEVLNEGMNHTSLEN